MLQLHHTKREQMTVYLNEGDKHFVQGSGKSPYEVKKVGGVVSCSCPAWRNMGGPLDVRVCKHIKKEIDPACLLAVAQLMASSAAPPVKAAKSTAMVPPVLLAHTWAEEDPTGWFISEKLDGVRAYWDGKALISRLGNVYRAPPAFLAMLPAGVTLDGELWIGRGKFQQTVSAVRKLVPSSIEWLMITYVVFDAPNVPGPFEARQQFIADLHAQNPVTDWKPLKQTKCVGMADMLNQLEQLNSLGAEGLMLREPGSAYEVGRSKSLLKVKTCMDAEAVVTGHLPGKGRHKGRLGALLCETPNGTTFEIGSGLSDKERENPPSLGTVVTYKYWGLTDAGKPRFPIFLTARDYE